MDIACRSSGTWEAQFVSPTAELLNQYAWGQITKGKYGVVFHAPYFGQLKPGYRPVALMHASMRNSNPVYHHFHHLQIHSKLKIKLEDGQSWAPIPYVVLAVASESKLHWSMKTLSQKDDTVIECDACYPNDSGSNRFRNTSLAIAHGTSCSSPFQHEPNAALCLNSTCLTSVERDCTCDYESVPGSQYAEHFLRFLQHPPQYHPQYSPLLHACWYPGTVRGMKELMAAANSIYLNRKAFYGPVKELPLDEKTDLYGWTECSCSPNIMDRQMVDAIAIILPPTEMSNHSLCSLSQQGLRFLQDQLRQLHRRSYTSLPIAIMQQTKGMSEEECASLWGGDICQEGYRKYFVSETYSFEDGTCLGMKMNENEVYYIQSIQECSSLKNASLSAKREPMNIEITTSASNASQFSVSNFGSDPLVKLEIEGGDNPKYYRFGISLLLVAILLGRCCTSKSGNTSRIRLGLHFQRTDSLSKSK